MYGPCNLKSKYGGVFFYGIHQVDSALIAFGYDVSRVLVTKTASGGTGQMIYPDGKIVTLNFLDEYTEQFAIGAFCEGSGMHGQVLHRDSNQYLSGVKMFAKMFKTGVEPVEHEHIMRPVQVLDAMKRSLKSGVIEKVCK